MQTFRWKFSGTSKTISATVSAGEFIYQLLLKVMSLLEKSTGGCIFEEKMYRKDPGE